MRSESGWAASRAEGTYLAAQSRRLLGRRGKKRALVAVGHSILVVAYHLRQEDGDRYRDLGGDFFDKLDPQRLTHYQVKRLERLGHKVTQPIAA